jgi:hypothetical protein
MMSSSSLIDVVHPHTSWRLIRKDLLQLHIGTRDNLADRFRDILCLFPRGRIV